MDLSGIRIDKMIVTPCLTLVSDDFLRKFPTLDKCIDILPDVYWHLLYFWYKNRTVHIRGNNILSNRIRVERGTRQGGLSWFFV